MEIIFLSHANKTHFHKKVCAPSLILKVRVFRTRKWNIGFWILRPGFRIPGTRFRIACQWNLDSRFQSLVGFWISWAELRTNQPRDWQATRTTSWMLKAMQERNLCSQGNMGTYVQSGFWRQYYDLLWFIDFHSTKQALRLVDSWSHDLD